MRIRTAVPAALLAAVALTACGTSTGDSPDPKATTSQAPSTAKPDKADAIADCTEAIKDGRDEGDGAPECIDLPLDDYYDALAQANKDGLDERARQREAAEDEDAG